MLSGYGTCEYIAQGSVGCVGAHCASHLCNPQLRGLFLSRMSLRTGSTIRLVVGAGFQLGLLSAQSPAAEGQGRSRKLSITLVKQPAAATGQQQQQLPRFTVWECLLAAPAADDAPKSPEKRDQAAKEG
jgi:hypothetical protein